MELLERRKSDNGKYVVTTTLAAEITEEFKALFTIKYNSKYPGDSTGMKRKKGNKVIRYIYLMYNWDSPYMRKDEKDRKEAVINTIGIDWEIDEDEDAQKAIKFFIELQNDHRQLRALQAARKVVDNMITFMEDLNVNERDENNKLVHRPKDVLTLANEINEATKTLNQMEKEAKDSLSGQVIGQGGKKIRQREK